MQLSHIHNIIIMTTIQLDLLKRFNSSDTLLVGDISEKNALEMKMREICHDRSSTLFQPRVVMVKVPVLQLHPETAKVMEGTWKQLISRFRKNIPVPVGHTTYYTVHVPLLFVSATTTTATATATANDSERQ